MSQEGYERISCWNDILPEPEGQGVQSMSASEIGNRSLMTLSSMPVGGTGKIPPGMFSTCRHKVGLGVWHSQCAQKSPHISSHPLSYFYYLIPITLLRYL